MCQYHRSNLRSKYLWAKVFMKANCELQYLSILFTQCQWHFHCQLINSLIKVTKPNKFTHFSQTVFIRKDLTKFYHFQCRIYLFKTLIHVATGLYTQLEVSFLRLFCLRLAYLIYRCESNLFSILGNVSLKRLNQLK